jgi:light-regulated signal transduction histidine kinase (bacteriophytochrome)
MDITTKSKPSDEITPQCLVQSGAAVADLAHLVKNILQILSGCSEIIDLALKTNQIDRVRQAWQLQQPALWRLKKFQLDLIKYTKSYPLSLQPCDLNAVSAAALKQLDRFFAKLTICCSTRLDDSLPACTADGEKLRDAVLNLLITAADNLQDEPGQITLQTVLTESGDAVQIIVTDSGTLLDSKAAAALLTPHERCRNMLGTGLEIPLAKQVAEAHHGRLLINPETPSTNTLILSLQ